MRGVYNRKSPFHCIQVEILPKLSESIVANVPIFAIGKTYQET